METLRARERETLGDLVDDNQGAHWATSPPAEVPVGLARHRRQRARRESGGTSRGRFVPRLPGQLLETISPLGPDERLVLFLDSEGADYASGTSPEVANVLPRGCFWYDDPA